MDVPARRRFLGVAAVGCVTTVAGCVGGILDDSEDDNSANETDDETPNEDADDDFPEDLPSYGRWLSADLIDDLGELGDASVYYMDIQHISSEWSDEVADSFDPQLVAENYGIDEDDVRGILSIERTIGPDDTIVMGSVEDPQVAEELVETMAEKHDTGPVESDEYEGYEVFDDHVAVGSEAIVMSGSYRQLIDAYDGEAERITDTDDYWDTALRDTDGAGFSTVFVESDEPFELSGMAIDNGSDTDVVAMTGYWYFDDQAAAEAEFSAMEAEVEVEDDAFTDVDEFVDDGGKLTDIRREEDVVIVEAEIEDPGW